MEAGTDLGTKAIETELTVNITNFVSHLLSDLPPQVRIPQSLVLFHRTTAILRRHALVGKGRLCSGIAVGVNWENNKLCVMAGSALKRLMAEYKR